MGKCVSTIHHMKKKGMMSDANEETIHPSTTSTSIIPPFILFLFPLSIFFFYLSFLPFLSFLFFSICFILSSSLLHLLPSPGHLCSSGVLSFLLVRARSLCSVHASSILSPPPVPFIYDPPLYHIHTIHPTPSYTIVTTPLPKPQVQAPSSLSLFSTP